MYVGLSFTILFYCMYLIN